MCHDIVADATCTVVAGAFGPVPDEHRELHQLMVYATDALHAAFTPDHYNYAFLQNQDRHVHLHIIPGTHNRVEFLV